MARNLPPTLSSLFWTDGANYAWVLHRNCLIVNKNSKSFADSNPIQFFYCLRAWQSSEVKAVNPLYNEMGEILPSNFDKCFFRYDLMIGCAVYVTAEIYLWAILSLTAFYSEFKMIENHKVGAFKNFTTHSSYYVTAFGVPSEDIEHATISKLSGNVFCVSMEVFSKKIPLEKKAKIDFSFFLHSNANNFQRIPLDWICALLYFCCNSSDWNLWGMRNQNIR